MIEFVCTPLLLRIAPQGCHGNHAFSHSPNAFMFRNIVFSFGGGGGGGGGGGCMVGQIRFCGIGYPVSVLI